MFHFIIREHKFFWDLGELDAGMIYNASFRLEFTIHWKTAVKDQLCCGLSHASWIVYEKKEGKSFETIWKFHKKYL